ncbi:hypothetical protein PR048_032446, partial [Dryococelus australis]
MYQKAFCAYYSLKIFYKFKYLLPTELKGLKNVDSIGIFKRRYKSMLMTEQLADLLCKGVRVFFGLN